MTDRLLEELAGDCWERLRWVVCRRLGVLPWRVASRRRVLRYALKIALDERERRAGERGAAAVTERGAGGGFDMERFRQLGGRMA